MFPETHPGSLDPVWAVPDQTSSPASSLPDRPAGLSDCSSFLLLLLLPVYHWINVYMAQTFRQGNNCHYLSLRLQKHRLAILWLHLRFHRSVLFGGGLPGQRVRKLHKEQLVPFAQTPSVQQVRQNLRLGERRRFENGLWLLDFNFLGLLFYWRGEMSSGHICDLQALVIHSYTSLLTGNKTRMVKTSKAYLPSTVVSMGSLSSTFSTLTWAELNSSLNPHPEIARGSWTGQLFCSLLKKGSSMN